jgi:hypothetical protein
VVVIDEFEYAEQEQPALREELVELTSVLFESLSYLYKILLN